MGTTADKLNYLMDTKTAIKEALVAKGVSVDDTDTFRSYADKIGEIQSGGGEGDTITYWDITPNAELNELLLWAYMVKAQTPDGVVVNPIGIYYVQGGATEYVTPLAIALDIKRVVLVENGAIQSLYDVLGTDDLSSFGARILTRDEFYNINT